MAGKFFGRPSPASATDPLLFDSFEASPLRTSVWTSNQGGALTRNTADVTAFDGSAVLKVEAGTVIGSSALYDGYPEIIYQGANIYLPHVALGAASYTTGIYSMFRYRAAFDSRWYTVLGDVYQPGYARDGGHPGGGPSQGLSNGMYSRQVGAGDQQDAGQHGYATLIPARNGAYWYTIEINCPVGTNGVDIACYVAKVTGAGNSQPFDAHEVCDCTPGGGIVTASNIFALNSVPSTSAQTSYADMTGASGSDLIMGGMFANAYPVAGDTVTGRNSGATRVLGTGHNARNGGGPYVDWNNYIGGAGMGYSAYFYSHKGGTWAWPNEVSRITGWDRNTYFYIGSQLAVMVNGWTVGQTLTPACVHYYDKFELIAEDRNDTGAFPNVGACYNPVTEWLEITFQMNKDLNGSTVECRISQSDIHGIGWAATTAWRSFGTSGAVYEIFDCYKFGGALSDTFSDGDLYVGLKITGRDGIYSIRIPTAGHGF